MTRHFWMFAFACVLTTGVASEGPTPVRGGSHPRLSCSQDETVATWIERQQKIRSIIPAIIPAVVAIDGGSGVIVNPEGLILTAAHVVGFSGRKVDIHLADGRKVVARVLGTDQQLDTAVLRLEEGGPWPHIPLAFSARSSDRSDPPPAKPQPAQPGEWCLALGYPSSFPRDRPAVIRLGQIQREVDSQLVSNCSIMGGDSGGPLLNLEGELIGINSRVKSSLEHNHHIPVQTFVDHWQRLTNPAAPPPTRDVLPSGPYLGIKAETDQTRVRIRSVSPDSPAATAGLLPEDVILMFDGHRITDFQQILDRMGQRSPGEPAEMIVNRFGQLISLKIVPGRK